MSEIRLTQEQIVSAVNAGMAITNPEDDNNVVPMKHAAGALVLRQLLFHIGNGDVMLTAAPPPPPAVAEVAPAPAGDKEPEKKK